MCGTCGCKSAETLSKTSCCCGADEANPCACMKAPEPMECSAKAPKCACYKALEKNAEYDEEDMVSCRHCWNVIGNEKEVYGDETVEYEMANDELVCVPCYKEWMEEYKNDLDPNYSPFYAESFEASNRKCGACGETGHNARTCKSKSVPFSTGGLWNEKTFDGLEQLGLPFVDASHVAMISKIVDGEVLKEPNARAAIPRITWNEEPITMTRGELDEMCKAEDLISIGESTYSCSYLRSALAYLPKNTVLTCYTGYHYPLKATFEYGGEEWIFFLAPRVKNWYAESFEAPKPKDPPYVINGRKRIMTWKELARGKKKEYDFEDWREADKQIDYLKGIRYYLRGCNDEEFEDFFTNIDDPTGSPFAFDYKMIWGNNSNRDERENSMGAYINMLREEQDNMFPESFYDAETFEAKGGKRMYCPNCKMNRTWNSAFKKQKYGK